MFVNQTASLVHDTITCNSYMRGVSSDYFRVFGVKGADGSSPEQLSGKANFTDIIITDNLARRLFPDRPAVGEWVKNNLNGDSVRIAAYVKAKSTMSLPAHQSATYIPLIYTKKYPFYYLDAPYLGVYIRYVLIPTEKILFVSFVRDARTIDDRKFLSWRYAPDERL